MKASPGNLTAGITGSSELGGALARLRPSLRQAAWFSLVTSLLALTSTVYMLEVYDRVLGSRNLGTLLMLTVAALGAYVVLEILEWVRARVMAGAARQFEAELSPRVFDAGLLAEVQGVKAISRQALADLRTLRELLAASVVTAAMDMPVSLLLLVAIFMIHPVLGWFAVLGGAIQVLLAWLTERFSHPPLARANRMAIAAQQYAENSLRNAQAIKALGMLNGVRERWMACQREFLALQALASEHAGGLMATAKLVQMVQASALLGLGCWLFLRGELAGGGGMMIVASILGGKILQPLIQVVAAWKQVIQGRDAWQRLNRLLLQVPARQPGMPLPPVRGELTVDGITASAPGSNVPIIRNARFHLPAGESLAIIGPSAAGKTTLARLLVGVWPAASGKVRLDGADIHHWNKDELGRQIGYLPQNVALFDGSLAENVARFGDFEEAQVMAALRQVGLGDWVAGLPAGIHTRIGEDGDFLSGGVRQRVGLARALYGNPRYVVLDEPNSNLDQAGEQALLDTLQQLKAAGTTVVAITHRQGLLKAVSRLLLLVDGVVQACGPRDEVLASLASKTAGKGEPALRAA